MMNATIQHIEFTKAFFTSSLSYREPHTRKSNLIFARQERTTSPSPIFMNLAYA
jgi:hypothetical protein